MQPRLIVPNATHMVTRRTLRRYHLLRPDPEVTKAFTYLVCVLAPRYGILIHAAVLMSTHYHLVLTDTRGRLPAFLAQLNRLMALIVKVLRKWEGPLWDHEEPSIVELMTPRAFVEETAYIIANPAEAGTVKRGRHWPGLVTDSDDLGRRVLCAKRPTVYLDPNNPQWPEEAELPLTLPEALPWEPEETRALVEAEVGRREHAAAQQRARKNWGVLGVKRILKQSPYKRAKSFEPLTSRNPTFAVGRGNRGAFFEAVLRLRTFRRLYREARKRFKSGIRDVLFPEGTYAMVVHHGVATAPS